MHRMWELGLRCHRRMMGEKAKVGGMPKSEVIISGEELSSARERNVGVGRYVGRVEALSAGCDTFSVHRQLGVELLAEEPEAVAETGEVVGEVAAV